MFCPVCKAEYRPGFSKCKDCDVDLVERLPEPAGPAAEHEVDYVPLVTVQGLLEGSQLRSFLEANGIPTLVYGETVRKTHGIVSGGTGATTILVPGELEDTARDLLAKADRGELEIEDSSE